LIRNKLDICIGLLQFDMSVTRLNESIRYDEESYDEEKDCCSENYLSPSANIHDCSFDTYLVKIINATMRQRIHQYQGFRLSLKPIPP